MCMGCVGINFFSLVETRKEKNLFFFFFAKQEKNLFPRKETWIVLNSFLCLGSSDVFVSPLLLLVV